MPRLRPKLPSELQPDPVAKLYHDRIIAKLTRVAATSNISALSGKEWQQLAKDSQALNARQMQMYHALSNRANDVILTTIDAEALLLSGIGAEGLSRLFGFLSVLFGIIHVHQEGRKTE